jgi:hypothetical protein
MQFLLLLVFVGLLALPFIAACTTPDAFDVLRSKVEDLGPELYQRATWRDIWSALIPRGEWPKGRGYVASNFKIGRSEPATDEESWETIQPLSANSQGANITTWNQVYVGEKEDTYAPEKIGLMGPLLNQDDLTMYWNSDKFWNEFFSSMEKRNLRTISNRLGNVYRQYVPKASCNSSFSFVAGTLTTQPAPQCVDLAALITAGLPDSELTQEMLDQTAEELMQEGAQDGDTNGWITMGEDGPEFPLYVGSWMSKRISLNNSELRNDYNQSFMGREDVNPVIKRVGAKKVVGNFRHVINLFPARWAVVANSGAINYVSTGKDSTTSVVQTATVSISGAVATVTIKLVSDGSTVTTFTTTAASSKAFIRIPTYAISTSSTDVTKGRAPVINGCWRDPAVAQFESAEVLSPLVMTEEILMPVNGVKNAQFSALNYYGEWDFVRGNDALLGINTCTGVADPLKKQGRHFGEFRHGLSPILPVFGRMLLFRRCSSSFDTVTCS